MNPMSVVDECNQYVCIYKLMPALLEDNCTEICIYVYTPCIVRRKIMRPCFKDKVIMLEEKLWDHASKTKWCL